MSELPVVAIEHRKKEGLIKGTYMWPYLQPTDTYTIQTEGITVDLDTRFPLRPAKIVVSREILDSALEPLAEYFGDNVAQGFETASRDGLLTVRGFLTDENRLAFAALQAYHPLTPESLRQSNLSQMTAIEHIMPTRGDYAGGEAGPLAA